MRGSLGRGAGRGRNFMIEMGRARLVCSAVVNKCYISRGSAREIPDERFGLSRPLGGSSEEGALPHHSRGRGACARGSGPRAREVCARIPRRARDASPGFRWSSRRISIHKIASRFRETTCDFMTAQSTTRLARERFRLVASLAIDHSPHHVSKYVFNMLYDFSLNR